MTKITNANLNNVFRTLNQFRKEDVVPRKISPNNHPNIQDSASTARSNKVLKSKIRQRLLDLDDKSDEYFRNATVVTVEEILVWEFGEKVLSSANYPNLKKSMIAALVELDDFQAQLSEFFKQIRQTSE